MSEPDPFLPFAEKMRAENLGEPAIRAFENNYRALQRKETGLIGEESITSVPLPLHRAMVTPPSARATGPRHACSSAAARTW